MDIQYIGHSCFRVRGKEGIVITDPFSSSVGFSLPQLRADIVTVSHPHADHNALDQVKPTANREKIFPITNSGEYEVTGISVYGYTSWHDEQKGAERGENTMFSIFIEDVHVLHLGDLGHKLSEEALDKIPDVDVLLCPVGGVYTIGPDEAAAVVAQLDPTYVVPMHYKTSAHNSETFGELATVEEFVKALGKAPKEMDKLTVTSSKRAGGEETETQLIILTPRTE